MARDDGGGEERSGGGGGEEEQEERTDGWMATYADMVTLLMTFFVLMFAISNVDQQKAMLFFAGMSRDGISYEQFAEIVDRFGTGAIDDPDGDLLPIPSPAPGDGEMDNPELMALFELITGYIDDEGLADYIIPSFNGEFLLLTLANDIWFESARAEITPPMREVAVVLAQLIDETHNEEKPFEVVVAGHTDNVPINTVRFPSNWHVSVARAVNFLEVLVVESGLDPGYFYARGCGEERPIADNETPEGRQRNRRVEVMISLPRDDDRRDGAFG